MTVSSTRAPQVFTHTYDTPTMQGQPWTVTFKASSPHPAAPAVGTRTYPGQRLWQSVSFVRLLVDAA